MSVDQITFIRKPAKHGWITTIDPDTKEKSKEQTYVFTIPQNYIRSGMVDTSKKYKILITPIDKSKKIYENIIDKLEKDYEQDMVPADLYHQLLTKYEEKMKPKEESLEEKKDELVKLIYNLDERLTYGQINQETYYMLIERFNKRLDEVNQQIYEEEAKEFEDEYDYGEDDYGDIDLG